VIHAALEISKGKRDHIELGNLNVKRDFGSSEKYVEVMWMMMQTEKPDDYVICSGQSIALRDIVDYVFKKLGIGQDRIVINPRLFRPTEIVDIYGSAEKARTGLGWDYHISFFRVLDMIIEEEIKNDV
jgi:GDPmannose 4,6-dehydratase